jgi:hypothetical protein
MEAIQAADMAGIAILHHPLDSVLRRAWGLAMLMAELPAALRHRLHPRELRLHRRRVMNLLRRRRANSLRHRRLRVLESSGGWDFVVLTWDW